MKQRFTVGSWVQVKNAPKPATIYEIVDLIPNGECWIRQVGTAANGMPYSEQHFDTSILKLVVRS